MKKLTLLIGVGIGYVLGTRAGRERYEQIRGRAKDLAANHTVRSATTKAQETVTTQASAAAAAVADKVGEKVGGGSDAAGPAGTSGTSGTSPADGQPLTRS